jgi:rRNA maturation RNase YbeY|tara:strand:+ start:1699 stop:2094 length:396 start_codon:yes stop_codon:yes gene_type:complete
MSPQIDEDRIKEWLISSALVYSASVKKLVYSFVSKEHMLSLNLKYLNHNTHTDILTFPYGTNKNIVAEVYISTEQTFENAKIFNQSIENETLRLISHGFLHCLGFHDKTKALKNKMSNEEDKMINMFHVKH